MDQIKYNILYFLLGFSFFIFWAAETNAARVYLEPQPGVHMVGDSVTFSVVLDTEGQSVNAVDLGIDVPKLFTVKSLSKSGSVIQLWIADPTLTNNKIKFVGGIPGGINTGRGIIGKIVAQASAIGDGNISFSSDSSVLLNDGRGTELKIGTSGGPVFKIIPRPDKTPGSSEKPGSSPTPSAKPEKEKSVPALDTKKPQKFNILIGNDPRLFGGQDFISFFTTDKDSGVDHYEVKEGKGEFKNAQSPYLLSYQDRRTVIRVRAYDADGNYRETVYPGLLKRAWWVLFDAFSFF